MTIPLASLSCRKEEEIIFEGHSFAALKDRLSDYRQKGFAPLHSPFFSTLLRRGQSGITPLLFRSSA